MDWPLLLSKHPHPILDDEAPLLVLAFIEKAGIITEDDLEESMAEHIPSLKSVLLKLHLNELIEYGSNSVRATYRGHQVLGQFGISSEILQSILEDCSVSKVERQHYLLILEAYRKYSHRLYQNSLCSYRQWNSFSDSLPDKVTGSEKTNIRQAGLSLILRDVINWLVHSNAASTALNSNELVDAAKTLRSLWKSVSSDEKPKSDYSLHKVYLRSMYHQTDVRHLLEMPRLPTNNVTAILNCYHMFQVNHEPDEWFHLWSSDVTLPECHRFRSFENYIKRLQDSLYIVENSERRLSSLGSLYSSKWDPSRFTSFDSDNLLGIMFCSKSIADVAKRSGISEEIVSRMIDEIRSTCDRLLLEDVPNSGGNVN